MPAILLAVSVAGDIYGCCRQNAIFAVSTAALAQQGVSGQLCRHRAKGVLSCLQFCTG
jgi:hypothetical protein